MFELNDSSSIQLNDNNQLKHFLTTEGLSREILTDILDTADSFLDVGSQQIKKVPLLRGVTVANLFFENSTRTLSTFELAAKRLSADVLNLNISTSSTAKGETLRDTLMTLRAMHADMFVVRHSESGAAHYIAEHVTPDVAVINAGDGRHAHPTQAMLDMLTIRQAKQDFTNLTVAIVGDILHSRVARSQIHALRALGVPDIRLIAPNTLLPRHVEALGVRVFTSMAEGLKDVDVVMMLRLQKERMNSALLPSESEFFKLYGLDDQKLAYAKPDAVVLHPGPINRGVEIATSVADGPKSLILKQVTNGLAVRMAVMSMSVSGQNLAKQSSQQGAEQ